MTERCFSIESEAAMVAFGTRLAAAIPRDGLSLFLHGELGAGKTTLTRGIARGLGYSGAVKSPTYTLVEPYLELQTPLYHFDLYRLGDAEELEFMGIRDYFDSGAVLVVEWPERGGDFLPRPDLEISLVVEPQARKLRLQAHSDAGDHVIDSLQSQLLRCAESDAG
jgi:tRNA threonylcarbamoyladenosine biosynthesis protein TsaE